MLNKQGQQGSDQHLPTKIYPKLLVFSHILLMAIFAVDHTQRGR